MSTLRRRVMQKMKLMPAECQLDVLILRDFAMKERDQTRDEALQELAKPEVTNFFEGWVYGYEEAIYELLCTPNDDLDAIRKHYEATLAEMEQEEKK